MATKKNQESVKKPSSAMTTKTAAKPITKSTTKPTATAKAATPKKATAKAPDYNLDEILWYLNETQESVKKYKELLGFGYDEFDPNGVGNRITADDVKLLISKKLI